MTTRRDLLAAVSGVAATALGTTAVVRLAWAQSQAPLRILVGYSAGGGTDAIARALAQEIAPTLGRPVIVDNKPGAGGRIGAEALKSAPADGSTLMLAPAGLSSIQTIVYRDSLHYDFARDFAPVAQVGEVDHAVAVHAALDIADAKGLATWLAAHRERASFGTPAAGGLPHFARLLLGRALGTPLTHVPYRGGAPAALAVASGEVPIAISAIDDFVRLEADGRLRIIGTLAAQRSSVSPQRPTLVEQGYDVVAPGWTGLWTRSGTSQAAIDSIALAVRQALAAPALRKRFAASLVAPVYGSPAELMKLQQDDWARWQPVVAQSGFKPNQ